MDKISAASTLAKTFSSTKGNNKVIAELQKNLGFNFTEAAAKLMKPFKKADPKKMGISKGMQAGVLKLGEAAEAKQKYLRDKYRGGGYKVAALNEGELTMSKSEEVFNKMAQEDTRTYPISRALMTGSNIEGLSVPGRIYRRAAQGRKNLGQEGITSSEKELISKMKDDKSGKTYPISRLATSPVGSAVTTGTYGAVSGGMMAAGLKKGKGVVGAAALGAGLLGAGLGAANTILGRHIYSRSQIGRAKKGREGWTEGDKKLLTQIRESEKKAEVVFDKLAAGFLKTIVKGVKSYGKNIASDAKALGSAYKEGVNLTKDVVQSGGKASFGQLRKAKELQGVRNKAMVGLAGRVGLPAVVGYNMLNND